MNREIKVDVFTDVVCPWCLVGSVRLDKALAGLPEGVTVTVQNHPFYLDPTTPPEGVDVAEMLATKYGRDPREMWARVESEAAASGIALDLSQQPRLFPTAKAHTIVRLLAGRSEQHALANRIAEAYFLEHRLINEDDVLVELAAPFGLTREAVLAALHDPIELVETAQLAEAAARQGITGVPFFVFNEKFALSGCQPEHVFGKALEMALEEENALERRPA